MTHPGPEVAKHAVKLLNGKGISTDGMVPKGLDGIDPAFDMVISMDAAFITWPSKSTKTGRLKTPWARIRSTSKRPLKLSAVSDSSSVIPLEKLACRRRPQGQCARH